MPGSDLEYPYYEHNLWPIWHNLFPYQSGEAHPSTSFWRSDDRSNEFISRSDDRSSETVWRGDDRSSDRHLFPLIDHRKRFDGEMIALMTGTYFRWSIIGKINRFAVHKSDHLPVKTFPMIDHLTAKLFPMIDHREGGRGCQKIIIVMNYELFSVYAGSFI